MADKKKLKELFNIALDLVKKRDPRGLDHYNQALMINESLGLISDLEFQRDLLLDDEKERILGERFLKDIQESKTYVLDSRKTRVGELQFHFDTREGAPDEPWGDEEDYTWDDYGYEYSQWLSDVEGGVEDFVYWFMTGGDIPFHRSVDYSIQVSEDRHSQIAEIYVEFWLK